MRVVCLATTLFAMWAVVATPATADELPNCVLDDAISASIGKVRLASVQPWLPIELSTSLLQPAQCCKICRKGKACGNSCIKRSYACTKPPGCACDGN